MTTPDNTFPDVAVNFDSLAAFAAKTEEDWTAEINAQAELVWGGPWADGEGTGVLGALFDGLEMGSSFVYAILKALARALGLGGVFDTVEDIIGGIGDFMAGVVNGALDALNWIVKALGLDHVFDFVGDAADWIGGFIKNITKNILKAFLGAGEWTLDHLATWAKDVWDWLGDIVDAVWAGLTGAATWVGNTTSNLIHTMFVSVKHLFGISNQANNNALQLMAQASLPQVWGSWQADLTDDVCFAHTMIDGTVSVDTNNGFLIPITINSDRLIEAVKISTPTPDATMTMAIFKVDRTTGKATPWIDLRTAGNHVGTASNLKVIPLAEPVSVERGQLLYIWAQANGPLTLHGWSTPTTATTGLVPKALGLGAAKKPLYAFPDELMAAQVGVNPKAAWASVGRLVPRDLSVTPKTYSDNFNRGSSSDLGAAWQQRMGSLGVKTWHVGLFGADRTSAYPRTTSTRCISTHVPRMATPNHEVQWTPYTTADGGTAQSYALCRFDGNGKGVFVQVGWWSNAYQVAIATGLNYDPSASTVRRSVSVTNYYGFTPFKVVAQQNTISVYHLNRDGNLTLTCDWTDFGGAYTWDSSSTEVGFGGNGSQTAIDDWIAKDLN